VVANFFNTCTGGIGPVSVLLGNGNGTFQSAINYSAGEVAPVSVAIADVNLDGHPDLVVSGPCNNGCNGSPAGVSVLLGNGNGTFQSPVTYGLANGAGSVVVGDVNGDGRPDLVVATGCGNCGPGQVSILLGNGNGTFQAPVSYSTGNNFGPVAIGDLNRDGHLDVVAVGPQTVSVMLGKGDGTFGAPVMYGTGGSQATSVAIADINRDGHLDLVVANVCQSGSMCQSGSAGVLLGKGDGTFHTAVSYLSGGGEALSIAIADVNGDGKADLVLANACYTYTQYGCAGSSEGVLGVLLGNGDGTFQSASRFDSGGAFAFSGVIADVNGDKKPDLVVANYSSASVDVLLNTTARSATTTTVTSAPNPSSVNQSVTFTATVTSAKPIPDGSTITFYAGTTLLGTGTTKGGVATFVTAFSTAKSYTIKAKYPGDGFHSPSYGTVTQIVQP
jgi:hypothetical protein